MEIAIDWKSDVNPSSETRKRYADQLRDYLQATGAQPARPPWGAIVKAVLDDPSAIAMDPKLKKFRLRNLQVTDPAGFTIAVRRHLTTEETVDEEWIGPAEAAELLKVTYAFFWRLVRARPDLIKPQRDGSRPYLVADIQAVSETYIFVGEIAFRRELHPRLAVAWLKAMGLTAAFSVREKQDIVYLRKTVEPALERWNMKDDATKARSRFKRLKKTVATLPPQSA